MTAAVSINNGVKVLWGLNRPRLQPRAIKIPEIRVCHMVILLYNLDVTLYPVLPIVFSMASKVITAGS
jgi:hypothetical protein